MSNADKPSIAELQKMAEYPGDPTQQSVLLRADVALALLEIAAAALRYRAGMTRSEVDTGRCEALDRVLAKVCP